MAQQQNRTMLIIGNGPSTKELADFGFHNIPSHIDTFGMGLSYKYFSKINWWPTFYICADKKVVKSKEHYLRQLILDEAVGVRKFFFPIPIIQHPRLEIVSHSSTGDFAFRKAVEYGYEQIFIIGIDLDYKPLKEATRITREEFKSLELGVDFETNVIYKVRQPIKDHPNYFFPEYQEVGDIYSEPRGSSWHLLSWQRALELSLEKQIPVRNLGKASKLPIFHKAPLVEALKKESPYPVTIPQRKASSLASDIYKGERAVADAYLRDYIDAQKRYEALEARISERDSAFAQSLHSLAKEIAIANDTYRNRSLEISVIIPCYNSADFIQPCLEALRIQTLNQSSFEVICVDDFSTDNTVKLIESYQEKIKNLRIIRHEKNRKQGAARNSGLDAARGRFILFVDSDDYLRADALEFMLGSGDKVDVTVCQHVRTRFDKPTRWEVSNRHVKSTLALAALENCIGWWSFGMLISREMIEKNQIRFREGVYFEDIDFNIRVFLASQSHVVTKEVLYYYIDRNDSTVNSINEKKLLDSVGAIAVVASMLSDRRAEERERFYKKASAWLQLQARRIRDCGEDKDERIALAGIFIMELKEAGLLKKLAPDLEKQILGAATAAPASSTVLGKVPDNFCFNPWLKDFACEFFERVIFFCEVDYHIRSAAPVARQLRLMGINSVIIDASRSTTFTSNRPLPDDELPLYADVDLRSFNIAETLPFATNAAAFVFMNDLTYTKRLIFENFGFGVPTFGFYEGINDDWNLDRKALRRPYRSVDYLLLPGIYQQGFYSDRETRVVGLPNVRSRLAQPYVQPTKRRAIINVNFTYGVLEDRRDLFVESAVAACTEAGLDYIITQHPADKGVLSRYNVGTDSVYSLLEEGTILISRFSTTILEALAMGRPAIYHNPIDERVPKFKFPLGAYSITDGKDALKQALESELTFLDDGGDIRKRAALFLHFHCNTGDSIDPDLLAARAIAEVVRSPGERYDFKRHVNNRVATTPQTGQVNVSVGSALDLTELAVQLLLDPQSGRARLRDEAAAIEQGLAALPENSPVRQHFQRVRAFAEAE